MTRLRTRPTTLALPQLIRKNSVNVGIVCKRYVTIGKPLMIVYNLSRTISSVICKEVRNEENKEMKRIKLFYVRAEITIHGKKIKKIAEDFMKEIKKRIKIMINKRNITRS